MSEQKVINVTDLKKEFGSQLIWEDLTLTLTGGEIVGLIGANGSGKTTFFKALLGMTSISSGEISSTLDFEKDVGFLLEIALFDYLSARKNIKVIGLHNNQNYSDEQITHALNEVGLAEVGNKKVKAFSFGMKQRLRLALATIVPRKLLILDEPLLGLDPEGIKSFLAMIQKAAKENKTAVIISTHQITEMSHIFDRFVFLKDKSFHIGQNTAVEYSVLLEGEDLSSQLTDLLSTYTDVELHKNQLTAPNVETLTRLIVELQARDIVIVDIDKNTGIQKEVYGL